MLTVLIYLTAERAETHLLLLLLRPHYQEYYLHLSVARLTRDEKGMI